jgi:hypothetical protein
MTSISQPTTFIYGLCDPTTEQLRYVGMSKHPTERRYQHVCASHLTKSCHKNHWIKSLLSKGLRPEVFVIEEVPSSRWQEAERFWIAYFRSIGANLTNSTIGGDGAGEMSAETRKKIGDSCRGKQRMFSETHRANLTEALRARRRDHPEWWAELSRKMQANRRNFGHEWTETSRKKLGATKKAAAAGLSKEERRAFAMSGVVARLAVPQREIKCVHCNSIFHAREFKAMYCSGRCKQAAHRRREKEMANVGD